MYKIHGITFHDYEQVIDYAWNEYKIACDDDGSGEGLTEVQKQEACAELEQLIDEV